MEAEAVPGDDCRMSTPSADPGSRWNRDDPLPELDPRTGRGKGAALGLAAVVVVLLLLIVLL